MHTPDIVVLAGSTRRDSWNARLAKAAANAIRNAGGQATEVSLRDHPMPLYDGDLEASSGVPETARKLKALFAAQQGILIASPEYNGSLSGVLKNTLDWLSRPMSGEPPLAPFKGKVAALLATSPGPLGGLRGLSHLQAVLTNLQVLVLPDLLAVPLAEKAFDGDELADPGFRKRLAGVCRLLVTTAQRLRE